MENILQEATVQLAKVHIKIYLWPTGWTHIEVYGQQQESQMLQIFRLDNEVGDV